MTSPAPIHEHKRRVAHAFDDVAGRYDLLTGMNPGYHRHLRMSAARLAAPPEGRLLDLCCGTGLSTRALLRAYPKAMITGLDASAGMLAIARKKRWGEGIRWIHGDAMDPAAAGATGPFDAILMAYGIRNVPDPDTCLGRLRELLAPGGTICFHEYSVRDSRRAQWIWEAVTRLIIIPAGRVTSPGSQIYRYLRESVRDFDGVRDFEARLRAAGFVDVRTEAMDGWQRGVVHSFLARRPR